MNYSIELSKVYITRQECAWQRGWAVEGGTGLIVPADGEFSTAVQPTEADLQKLAQ